jgi:hypothetical protein
MHPVLRKIITNPSVLQSQLSGNETRVAQMLRHLTRLSASELLMIIFNSYLYYFHITRISDSPLLPEQLIQKLTYIDYLYYQIAELYKEATDTVPPRRQDFIVGGGVAQSVTHDTLRSDSRPLVILKNPRITDSIMTIDLSSDLEFTIIY